MPSAKAAGIDWTAELDELRTTGEGWAAEQHRSMATDVDQTLSDLQAWRRQQAFELEERLRQATGGADDFGSPSAGSAHRLDEARQQMEREAKVLMDETSQTVSKMQASLAGLGGATSSRERDPRWASMLSNGSADEPGRVDEMADHLARLRLAELMSDAAREHGSEAKEQEVMDAELAEFGFVGDLKLELDKHAEDLERLLEMTK